MRKSLTLAALRMAIAVLLAVYAAAHAEAAQPSTSETLPGESVYNLTSDWTTQNGVSVKLRSFRGQAVVVAMIYTSCPDVCPLIVQDMQSFEAEISKPIHPAVHFVLVTFDPARDTPEHLSSYATGMKLDPKHWTLLNGSPDDVRDLAGVLGVRYRRKADGSFDHSVLVTLLDRDGVIIYQQVGSKHEFEALRTHLSGVLNR